MAQATILREEAGDGTARDGRELGLEVEVGRKGPELIPIAPVRAPMRGLRHKPCDGGCGRQNRANTSEHYDNGARNPEGKVH